MIYRKFNKYIKDLYFNDENIGSNIVMSVDEFVIHNFCDENHITNNQLENEIRMKFNYSWSFALLSSETLPNMFGLIAIQIYVASIMHNDNKFTSNNYNDRLKELLSISDDLQNIYGEYQNKLWRRFNKWIRDNGFLMEIPRVKSGKGCYIQYPLSQALLNQEDFKYIPLMFEKVGLKHSEDISFLDFKSLMKFSDLGGDQTTHYHRVKERLINESKSDLLFSQIYTFYNNQWDGKYPKNNMKSQCYVTREKRYYNISMSEDITEVIISNDDNKEVVTINLTDINLIEKLKSYYRFHSHLKEKMIFVKDDFYNDWIESRYFDIGKDYLMISKKSYHDRELIAHLDADFKDYSNSIYSIFVISTNNIDEINSYWECFFSQQPRSFSIENGLKLKRKSWMFGAGPDIVLNNKEDVWLNGQKLNLDSNNLIYSLKDLPVGTYSLKEKNQSPMRFSIEVPEIINEDCKAGWKLSKELSSWDVSYDDYNFIGLTTFFNLQVEKSGVRDWINSLINNSNKRNSSIVINAINRLNNGLSR